MPQHHKMLLTASLEHCIRVRRSIRFYKQDPVDEEVLRHCLKLGQLAPSNSNIQPWRLVLATGPARDRIVTSLKRAASQDDPVIPPLPKGYEHFRSHLGSVLYGEEGYDIPRDDKERTKEARMRNYEFFGAPVIGVITIDKRLGKMDAMTVGLFIQTFMLALTEQGLGSCLQISVTGYSEVLRTELRTSDDQIILCGIAIGYPAEHQVNNLYLEREPLENEVRFLTV